MTDAETYTEIEAGGAQADAKVMGLSRDQMEQATIDQLEELGASEIVQGDIRVMPDCHIGSGCTIGFTMRMMHDGPLRIVPNTVGVDVGCGMLATQVSGSDLPAVESIDESVRGVVPLGYEVHERSGYHLYNDFPWDRCDEKWQRTKQAFGLEDPEWFNGYGGEYFENLVSRLDAIDEGDEDNYKGYVINSMGTLGGGNHFIELGGSGEPGEYWFVIHSGSRNIGLKIAEHWQETATTRRTNDWIRSNLDDALERYLVPDTDSDELTDWFLGGKGQSYIDSEAIKGAVNDNYLIGYIHDQIRQSHPDHRPGSADLDYLEEQEAAGYLVDMIFAQTYAWENRVTMSNNILDELGTEPVDWVHTPHNLIDFEDFVLRKGAVRAHEGERFVLPFNMAEGTFICEGRGNEAWNRSSPHGAGRAMSRGQAFDEVEMEDFKRQMDGIYSTSVVDGTRDEAPPAYKPKELIENAIEPTADVVTKLKPVLNIKATD